MNDTPLFETALARLNKSLSPLPDKPEESAETTLRALWHAAAGLPKSAELAGAAELPPLDLKQQALFETLLDRRLSGTPLAHITRRQRFMELELLAGPEALIPRKETELLARTAIELLGALNRESPCVVDVCTGSGNVAIAIAATLRDARVHAADLGAEAAALARRNAAHVGVRLDVRSGDLLAPFDTDEFHGAVDVLTCNPPYIASTKVEHMPDEISQHEPRLAFDGGPFGVSVLMRLLSEAPRFLRPGGWLVFEVGLGQGASVARMLSKMSDYENTRAVADAQGAVRVIAVQRTGSASK